MNFMSKIQTIIVIGFTLIVCSVDAKALDSKSQVVRLTAPEGITSTFYACIDKDDAGTIEFASCLGDEKEVQDKRLSKAYRTLLNKLDSKGKKNLVNAERAWLKSHDLDGQLETSVYGDEIVEQLQMTQNDIFRLCERANVLEKYLELASNN
jgi:uncharacterized protein YecT (DUF1311 family)